MGIKKNVGRKLRDLRESAGLTQEKLAEAINVQINTISKVETGRHFISPELLTKLCKYFEVDESHFFNFNTINRKASDAEKIESIIRKLKIMNSTAIDYLYKIVNAFSE